MSLVGALYFVGIDWAAKTHAVCVLDPTGRQVAAFTIEHTAAGFTDLIARLGKLASGPGCRWRSNARTGGWSTRC